MELFTWILAAYGMSQILVYGSIFENQRNLIHRIGNPDGKRIPVITDLFHFLSGLISCMMCTSTWVGFFMSFFYSPSCELLNINNFMSIFFDGMLASGSVWAVNSIIEYFENKN
jgi:hypothetical protein